jgi:heavy metal sensor kinase
LWPHTLRGRLIAWYTAMLTATLVALGGTTLILLDRSLRANVDASLQSLAQAIAHSVRQPSQFGPDLDEMVESMLGPAFAERFFRLLDPRGRPDPRVAPRGRAQLPLSAAALRNAAEGRETYETFALPDRRTAPLRILTMPVIEQGQVIDLVQVAASLEPVETARSRFLFILLGLTPLALLVAGVGGWFLARRALVPVDAMVDAARRIEAEDLSRRIDTTDTRDELGRLAAVLNDMLARLEQSFAAVSQFSADAAHELRTPLTVLKGEIEVALRSSPGAEEYRRVLTSCLEEVDRLSALVEDLLFLARSEGGRVAVMQAPVNLAEIVTEVAPALQALADAAGVTLSIQPRDSAWVRGNTSMLFRVIFNLGENAIKYTPAGERVSIALNQSGDEVVLEVRDTGPGISAADLPHIFDRFYRADRARGRGGVGLGLALARSIVSLHGGTIVVESAPGAGACFRVVLPIAASVPEPGQTTES